MYIRRGLYSAKLPKKCVHYVVLQNDITCSWDETLTGVGNEQTRLPCSEAGFLIETLIEQWMTIGVFYV